jgi:hypothetical protein
LFFLRIFGAIFCSLINSLPGTLEKLRHLSTESSVKKENSRGTPYTLEKLKKKNIRGTLNWYPRVEKEKEYSQRNEHSYLLLLSCPKALSHTKLGSHELIAHGSHSTFF